MVSIFNPFSAKEYRLPVHFFPRRVLHRGELANHKHPFPTILPYVLSTHIKTASEQDVLSARHPRTLTLFNPDYESDKWNRESQTGMCQWSTSTF